MNLSVLEIVTPDAKIPFVLKRSAVALRQLAEVERSPENVLCLRYLQ